MNSRKTNRNLSSIARPFTVVGDAQKNPALARRVNVEITKLLAELAAEIQFVFFSTDLVFDGHKGNYTETDPLNPLHIYGETKAAAEEIVLKNPRHLVVRTSINGGTSRAGDRGFNEQFKLSLQNSSGMKLFTDEFRSPVPAGGNRAGGLGTGGEKLRRNFSRRRRGKIVALANRTIARQTLAGNQNEN